MTSAVDTNIILDVLIPGEPFCEISRSLLDSQISKGKLIICEIVFADSLPGFSLNRSLSCFLQTRGSIS